MKIKLRGHHLLCLQGFQGYGYSKDFVENMTRINSLRKSPSTAIELTDGADDICSACPNLKGNLCIDEENNDHIAFMDNEVLSKLPEREYSSEELFRLVNEIFNSKESLEAVCGNCSWGDKCLFIERFK